MIITLIYFIAAGLLQAFAAILALLNYNPNIATLFAGVTYVINFTAYFSGVIDLPAFYIALGVAIAFEIFWFTFLVAWYIIGFFKSLLARGSTQH